jgi:ribosomal protein S24E
MTIAPKPLVLERHRYGVAEKTEMQHRMQAVSITKNITGIEDIQLNMLGTFTEAMTEFAPGDFAVLRDARGKAWSWVDPLKEMNAAVVGLKNGILSIEDVASQYGKDAEELMAQIQRDKALAEQFGIKYALEPYGATFSQIEPDVYGGDDA